MPVFVRRKFRWIHQPWRWVPFALRLRAARVRAWMVCHRAVRRLLVAAALLLPVTVTAAVVGDAREAQREWGTTIEVVVVTSEVAPGDDIEPSGVRVIRLPTEFLADDALNEPIHEVEVATRALRVGDVLTRRDVRSMRDDLELPEGHRAVNLPSDPRLPPLQPGDSVDLFLMPDHAGFGGALEVSRQLDNIATVIDVTDEAVTLAVAERDVAELVTATSLGRVLVALR